MNYNIFSTIDPSMHSSLIGYWPFTGGQNGDFLENSGHVIDDVTADSSNLISRSIYGKGSITWVKMPSLWTLRLCKPGFFYNQISSTCYRKMPYIGYYVNNALQINPSGKPAFNTWNISLSLWVFHVSNLSQSTIINVNTTVNFYFKQNDYPENNLTLYADFGTVGNPTNFANATWNISDPYYWPTLGKWNHYGIILYYGISINICKFFVNGLESPPITLSGALSIYPSPNIILIGSPEFRLNGFVREVKIWARSLTDTSEMIKEKYGLRTANDDSLYLYWKFNEAYSKYILDYSLNPITSYILPFYSTDFSWWKYLDEPLEYLVAYNQTRAGDINAKPLVPISMINIPISYSPFKLDNVTVNDASNLTLEFWVNTIYYVFIDVY